MTGALMFLLTAMVLSAALAAVIAYHLGYIRATRYAIRRVDAAIKRVQELNEYLKQEQAK